MIQNRLLSNRKLQSIETNENNLMAVLALIVGLCGGLGAVGFRYLINGFQKIFYGSIGDLLIIAQGLPWHLKVWVPAVGGLMVGPMVYFLAREAKGHGVPEVMEAVTLKRGIIRKRIVIIKSLASAICIGSGGSVGREGPIVQIGSAIGSTIGQLIRLSAERMRTLVGCGAAAGIAATFNAPIAGTMFALEIILGDFGVATFSPIVISSVMATAVSRHFLGDSPAFTVSAYRLISTWEFPLYIILGLFCAVVGTIFTSTLYKTEDLFDELRVPEYLKAVIGGILLGVIALYFPNILSVGYGTIDLSFTQSLTWRLMLLLMLVKIFSTDITIGSGGSGGVFAPSLFLGAMAGGAFGTIAHQIFPTFTASPGAYSVVGMGAVVSATTRGPLTAILMLFEMTGDYKIILPLMITCIISSQLSTQMLKESIYTLKLVRRGIDIKAGKEINILKSIYVADVMNKEVEAVQERLTMAKLSEKISKSRYSSFPVLDDKGKLTGILAYTDYSDAMLDENLKDLVLVEELATPEIVYVSPNDNLYDALKKISLKDYSFLPVVAPDDPTRLLGILTRREIINAYNKAIIKKSLFN